MKRHIRDFGAEVRADEERPGPLLYGLDAGGIERYIEAAGVVAQSRSGIVDEVASGVVEAWNVRLPWIAEPLQVGVQLVRVVDQQRGHQRSRARKAGNEA